MAWIRTRLARLAAAHEKYAFFTQSAFDSFASGRSRRAMALGATVLAGVGALLIAAAVLMSPRLFSEGSLLLFGTETEARVIKARLVEQARTKSGAPRYRLDVSYELATPQGERFAGAATRTDMATAVRFAPGDGIRVVYDPRNPTHSTIVHNLHVDVIALSLFVPFLLIMAALSWLYVHRWWSWAGALS